jgi:hypothetical protein
LPHPKPGQAWASLRRRARDDWMKPRIRGSLADRAQGTLNPKQSGGVVKL